MKHGWRDADKHLEPMSCATLKCLLWNTRKCDVWRCSVHRLYTDPIHRILVPFPLLLVRCKTWFGEIKLLRIPVILIHGVHGCKEYRLSCPAWILSSRYQSWICNGVWTDSHIQYDEMYSRKLSGISTVSCSEESMGLRPEWPWRARR